MDLGSGKRVGPCANEEGNVRASYGNAAGKGRVHEDTLFPGIPNEITLEKIVSKLPWGAFYVLASVSVAWQQAIESRLVYDARVCSGSTQALVPIVQEHEFPSNSLTGPGKERHLWDEDYLSEEEEDGNEFSEKYKRPDITIHLYSLEVNCSYRLPSFPAYPIPLLAAGQSEPPIIMGNGVVCLDGKMFVVGGENSKRLESYNEVFVLDIAGHGRQWEQCESMARRRANFGCGVVDGKIYVFGGDSMGSIKHLPLSVLAESEVYDPKNDTWSRITSMPRRTTFAKVAQVGEELLLYGGFEFTRGNQKGLQASHSAYVYNPSKNKWRTLKNFNKPLFGESQIAGTADGKLYKIVTGVRHDGIYIYDMPTNTWKFWQSFSNPEWMNLANRECLCFDSNRPKAIAVDDELLVFSGRCYHGDNRQRFFEGCDLNCILRGLDFGDDSKEITWQKVRDFDGNFDVCCFGLTSEFFL